MNYLAEYIVSDDPFDAVMGFPQGAALAATLILRDRESTNEQGLSAYPQEQSFKCAFFLSGQLPFDCAGLMREDIRQLDPDQDNVRLKFPTANF